MKKLFLLSALHSTLALLRLSAAQAACISALRAEDYLVFARGNIEANQADFQGLTGALGSITTEDFQFTIHYALLETGALCTNVVAAKDIVLDQTGVEGGNVESGANIEIRSSHVRGQSIAALSASVSSDNEGITEHQTPSAVSQLPEVGLFFSAQSEKLSAQAGREAQQLGTALLLKAKGDSTLQTFAITSEQLNHASSVNFYGDAKSVFVVNISGADASIQNKPIRISPGMNPGQVILNFPDATSLTIANTHNPRGVLSLLGMDEDDFGGIPATILAPNANLNFTDGQIDGGVYVKSLTEQGVSGPNSGGHGQINRFPTPWKIAAAAAN